MATRLHVIPSPPENSSLQSRQVLREVGLARVLLVDTDSASRLTLHAVLEASGYRVDSVSSAAEAANKLDEQIYELVVSDLKTDSPEGGLSVLAHARLMEYQPATAILTTMQNAGSNPDQPFLIEPQDLPELLSKVADLISQRAARLVAIQLLLSASTA